MLGQRRRRWPNMNTTLCQRPVFIEYAAMTPDTYVRATLKDSQLKTIGLLIWIQE